MDLINPAVLHSAGEGTLLLLPDKKDDKGTALYRDDNAGLVKTIRQGGASIDFAWPKDQRVYVSEFSANDVIANIALGVIGNFTADTIKYLIYAVRVRLAATLRRSVSDDLEVDGKVSVKIAKFESSPDRRVVEGFEYTGPASHAREVIEALADHHPHHAYTEGASNDHDKQ